MTESAISWQVPPSVLLEGIDDYGDQITKAVEVLLTAFAPLLEGFAKAYAPWTDRTGNARQALFTVVDADLPARRATLYLSHGMEYGVYLELRWQGRYAIIMPTVHAYERTIWNEVRRMLS